LIGGVERQVFSAELGIEVVETTNYEIVWRGYGIHKVDDQTQQPLDVSLQKAAENVVRAAL
jgi:hypothetical protein